MTEQEIDALLYAGEGVTVDFKRQHYVLSQTDQTDDEFRRKKSDLLKDVLAMANGWRQGDAVILLGVAEPGDGTVEVIGLHERSHFDESILQQYLSAHLNKHLVVEYGVRPYKGRKVGFIRIPLDQPNPRPFYSHNDFGSVRRNTVYVRRGSSMHVAEPDEVARMGARTTIAPIARHSMSVGLAAERFVAGASSRFECEVPVFDKEYSLPDFTEPSRSRLASFLGGAVNRDYWRQLASWHRRYRTTIWLDVTLRNTSPHQLTNCTVHLDATNEDGVCLETTAYRPGKPKRYVQGRRADWWGSEFAQANVTPVSSRKSCHLERLRPGDEHHFSNALHLYLGSSARVHVKYRILADDLPEPITGTIPIDVVLNEILWGFDQLRAHDQAAIYPFDA